MLVTRTIKNIKKDFTKRAINICLVILTVTSTMSTMALPSDAKQPIKLAADKVTYRESTGITKYSGNVIISQGTLKINADSITLNLSNNRSIDSAVAQGSPARLEQVISTAKGKAKGQANTIDYNNITGIITLSGDASLMQDGASFSGNRIRYSLKDGDIEATGSKKQRVELIFPPNKLSNPVSVK